MQVIFILYLHRMKRHTHRPSVQDREITTQNHENLPLFGCKNSQLKAILLAETRNTDCWLCCDCLPYFDHHQRMRKRWKQAFQIKLFIQWHWKLSEDWKSNTIFFSLTNSSPTLVNGNWQFVLLVESMFMYWSRLIHLISSSDNICCC